MLLYDFSSSTLKEIPNNFCICLFQNGVILIGNECYEILSKKIKANYGESEVELKPVTLGSLEQLKELIHLVSEGKVRTLTLSLNVSDLLQWHIQKKRHISTLVSLQSSC